MKKYRVLVACEFSGIVRSAFNSYPLFYTISCDFDPPEDGQTNYHYQGNVMDIIDDDWDLMIAHPPCTYLANSGVRWLNGNKERQESMLLGAEFFKALLNINIKYRAIENPIMHKYAIEIIGRRQDQLVQPWMFGHPETKAICLWLENLPFLRVKHFFHSSVPNIKAKIHYEPPGKDRQKNRSRFYPKIAAAMAKQWTEYIINHE